MLTAVTPFYYYSQLSKNIPQLPTVACKIKAQSEHGHVAYTFFWHVWRRFVMLIRCSLTKISASEISRKFIKSVLLVGHQKLAVQGTTKRVCN